MSHSERQTLDLGKKIGKELKQGDVVALHGELGCGKTILVKGIARGLGLGGKERVTSPTFTLLHVYPTKVPLFHFDFYRLEGDDQVHAIGFEELVYDGEGISCIEWPEKARTLLPPHTLWVEFAITGRHSRQIKLRKGTRNSK